ncbi:MAG: hypothetical protein ACRELB_02115 [Polyangiaceae bacterium]
MRILLAGEGKTELGEWSKEAPHRDDPGEKGVLAALLERILGAPPEIAYAVKWSRIRKYRAGGRATAEERNVLGLGLVARRERCEAVVFSRDRDGDQERQRDLEEGLTRAREAFAEIGFVGGVAIENIEGWLLVLCGRDGERVPRSRTKSELEAQFSISSLEHKVDAVARARLDLVPAGSLASWIENARAVFDVATSTATST